MDKELVIAIKNLFTTASEYLDFYDGLGDFQKAVRFASATMDALENKEDRFWRRIKTKEMATLGALTNKAVILIWAAHKIAQWVNHERRENGKRVIDFYEAAKEYDLYQKFPED